MGKGFTAVLLSVGGPLFSPENLPFKRNLLLLRCLTTPTKSSMWKKTDMEAALTVGPESYFRGHTVLELLHSNVMWQVRLR